MPELYEFQKNSVKYLGDNEKTHIIIAGTGTGKTAISLAWAKEEAERSKKKGVYVVTTPSKVKTGDYEKEADIWNGEEWRGSLKWFRTISWYKLSDEVKKNLSEMTNSVVIFDEVAKGKSYSSGMGKAFRSLSKYNKNWAGFTATPGDKWIDFMNYMVACNLYKHKTEFVNRHCVMQNFKGYPEIARYIEEDVLLKNWRAISYVVDSSTVDKQMPSETHQVIEFKLPSGYKQCKKDSVTLDGEFIETTMGLCHYLRQICFSKDKQDWLKDFIENLGDNCVFFCNYKEEEDRLCEIAQQVLPKGARVWRIDGSHHEIPTEETIGKYDIVVAHYASGGEALNLQFMHYWCAVSPNYSYSMSVQARGRIKRIGQKHAMAFYYLKTIGSIECDIYKCLHNKEDFSEEVWCEENGIDTH